jgi:putative membrane protein
MTGFFLRATFAAIGLWVAARWVGGIVINDSTTLLVSAILLGIVNAIVRPIAIVLTLPITLVTLGFFLLIVNAAMVALVALLVPGFQILTFGAAFLTALIVSLCGWLGTLLMWRSGKGRG